MDIPAYAYDLWMPAIGLRPIGVYGLIWRLAREGMTKGMGLKKLAKKAKVGDKTLLSDLELLEKYGWIKIGKGDSRNSNVYYVYDIPTTLPAELVTPDYEPLTPWLLEEKPASLNEDSASSNNDAASSNEDGIIEPSIEPSMLNPSIHDSPASMPKTASQAGTPGRTRKPKHRAHYGQLSADQKKALEDGDKKSSDSPTPETVQEHPLTKWLVEINHNKPLPKKAFDMLWKDFHLDFETERRIIHGGLIGLYDIAPGFQEFCKETHAWMKVLPNFRVADMVSFLRNLNKPGDGRKKPGYYGWYAINKHRLEVPEEQQAETPVRVDRLTEKPDLEKIRREVRRARPSLSDEMAEIEAQMTYENRMILWMEQQEQENAQE